MKDVIYTIVTLGVSSKDILIRIKKMPEYEKSVICINEDGQNIHLKTSENIQRLLKSLEKKLDIKLHIK